MLRIFWQCHRLLSKLQLFILLISVEIDPCCWNRWIRSITSVERLLDESGARVMMDRIFSTNDTVIQCNAIRMLMSSGGVTQHIRGIVWAYCTDLVNEIDIERLLFHWTVFISLICCFHYFCYSFKFPIFANALF